MRAIAGLGAAVAVATSLLAAGGGHGAEMAVPDVRVTAPAQPPVPEYRKWSPYNTRLRVDEQQWPEIPCGTSRIALAGAAARCQRGAPTETAAGWQSLQGNGSNIQQCDIAHNVVTAQAGRLSIEADALVFDPYKVTAVGHPNSRCWVETWFKDMPGDFKDMNQMTRQGRDWRNYAPGKELSTVDFTLGANDCRAVEKMGPKWGAGYVYIYHASLCRTDGRPLEAIDIDYLLGAVQVSTYDPVGNLQRPP